MIKKKRYIKYDLCWLLKRLPLLVVLCSVMSTYSTGGNPSFAIPTDSVLAETGDIDVTVSITTQPTDLDLTVGAESGNVLTVEATAAEGYTLSYQWYENTSASIEDGTAISGATEASYTVPTTSEGTYYYYCIATATSINDTSQTATVTSGVATVTISAPPVPTYTITIETDPAEGGTVTGGSSGDYDDGTQLELTETPNEGYRFKNWTIDGVDSGSETTCPFIVNGACTVVAHFERVYQLSGDYVTFYLENGNEPITEAAEGETVTVSADPDKFPAGENKYFTGQYTATEGVTVMVNENGDGTFTMPAMAVTVSAVLADPKAILSDWITVGDGTTLVYNGQTQTPVVIVMDGETDITEQCDITYSNNRNAGTADAENAPTVTVTAKSTCIRYTGSATATFTIARKALELVADPVTIVEGEALPSFTGSITGFVEGEGLSGTDVLTFGVEGTPSATGSYAVTGKLNGEASGNYGQNYTFDNAAANATALTIIPIPTHAQRGLTYKITSLILHTAELSGYDGDKPTGELAIPASVNYEGTDYSVTSIADGALASCTSLTSVAIPASVTSIGKQTFGECTGLQTVTVYSPSVPTTNGIIFTGRSSNVKVYVLSDLVEAYKSDVNWSTNADIRAVVPITIPTPENKTVGQVFIVTIGQTEYAYGKVSTGYTYIINGVLVNATVSATLVLLSGDEATYKVTENKATKLTFGSMEWKADGALMSRPENISFSGADVDTRYLCFTNIEPLAANSTMTLVAGFGNAVGTITGTKYQVGTTLEGQGKASLSGNDLNFTAETAAVQMAEQAQTHNALMDVLTSYSTISFAGCRVNIAAEGLSLTSNNGEDGVAAFAAMDNGEPLYTVGKVADVHFDIEDSHNTDYLKDLKNALRYFEKQGVTYIDCNGDLCQYKDKDLIEFRKAYDSKLPFFSSMGNHDYLRIYEQKDAAHQVPSGYKDHEDLWYQTVQSLANGADVHYFGTTFKDHLNFFFERHGDLHVFISIDYGMSLQRYDVIRAINPLDYDDENVKLMTDYVSDTPYDRSRESKFDYRFYNPAALIWLKDLLEANPKKRVFLNMHLFLPSGAGDTFSTYRHLRIWPMPTPELIDDKFYSGTNTLCGLEYWFIEKLLRNHLNTICFGGHSHYAFNQQEDVVNRAYMVSQPTGEEVTPIVNVLNSLDGTEYDYQIYRPAEQSYADIATSVHIPSLAKPIRRDGTGYGASEGVLMEVYDEKVVLKFVRFKEEGSEQYKNEVVKTVEIAVTNDRSPLVEPEQQKTGSRRFMARGDNDERSYFSISYSGAPIMCKAEDVELRTAGAQGSTRGADEYLTIESGKEYDILTDGDLFLTLKLSEGDILIKSITVEGLNPNDFDLNGVVDAVDLVMAIAAGKTQTKIDAIVNAIMQK